MTNRIDLLRSAGLRVTQPRLAVLQAVANHPHADTNRVIAYTRVALPGVSHQAIYDVLRALTDVGLLRKIQPSGSVARYETETGDNHHHLVCRECGAVVDAECNGVDSPCLRADEYHGYAIDEAEVIYWGLCPECRNSEATQER